MMRDSAMRAANTLFHHAYPIYRPIYAAWKRMADRRERRLLESVVGQGMVTIDVGANIGVYTRLLSRLVGPDGLVHAIEPSPQNCARLRRAMRDTRNVRVHEAAASDHAGTLRLHLSPSNNADHRVFDSGDGRDSVQIACMRLDDCVPARQPVGFIKLDVQGHERHVLRGCSRILAESPAIRILMEFWPFGLRHAGVETAQMLEEIQAMGLRIDLIDGASCRPTDLLRLDPKDAGQYCNLVLAGPAASVPSQA